MSKLFILLGDQGAITAGTELDRKSILDLFKSGELMELEESKAFIDDLIKARIIQEAPESPADVPIETKVRLQEEKRAENPIVIYANINGKLLQQGQPVYSLNERCEVVEVKVNVNDLAMLRYISKCISESNLHFSVGAAEAAAVKAKGLKETDLKEESQKWIASLVSYLDTQVSPQELDQIWATVEKYVTGPTERITPAVVTYIKKTFYDTLNNIKSKSVC